MPSIAQGPASDTAPYRGPFPLPVTPLQHRFSFASNCSYIDWYTSNGGVHHPIGKISTRKHVAVVGAGVGGLFTAQLLRGAGCDVTVLERAAHVGGRARSDPTHNEGGWVEQGAMRFPVHALSAAIVKAHGFELLGGFPDPGVVRTGLSFEGEYAEWEPHAPPPGIFEDIDAAWTAFIREGLSREGERVLAPIADIIDGLAAKKKEVINAAAAKYRAYVDVFQSQSLEQGTRSIFSGKQYDRVGPVVWSEAHFEADKALGRGSGGLGAVSQRSMVAILELIINQMLVNQASFGVKAEDGTSKHAPVQALPARMAARLIKAGGKVRCGQRVTSLGLAPVDGVQKVLLNVKGAGREVYDDVVLAIPPNAAKTVLARSSGKLMSRRDLLDLNSLDTMNAVKLYVELEHKHYMDQPGFPRVLLSDTPANQSYLFEDAGGRGGSGVVTNLIAYQWGQAAGELAEQYEDKIALRDYIAGQMRANLCAGGGKWHEWIDDILAAPSERIHYINWDKDPSARGAFVLMLPGQEKVFARISRRYLRLSEEEMHVHLVGDSYTRLGGWIEAAFVSASDFASAYVRAHGELFNARLSPVVCNAQ
ncbi:FAD/NAD(P)-binding domain-containing protein [Jaminaea rosea]|uniref:FAD/NAD(P)-binding domain-containing protein n=1 Tax=Jaminaea rosea TaxID=1569628 RepID=A0A316UJP5_9BASI|nr:FAD/NAD(P)-binding domain-containing protein [Jaminaea rosea]PWN25450.1 FAD/NAD(P)-binding domain-containing protein [Jaminaea rosea]